MTEREIPKSEWGPGPWQSEPDMLRWTDKETGLRCMMIRTMHTGAWCGYVGVQPGHPAYELHYNGEPAADAQARREDFHRRTREWDMSKGIEGYPESSLHDESPVPGVGDALRAIECHGGLTWAGRMRPKEQAQHIEADIWWFGFDCAHAFDQSPAIDALFRHLPSALSGIKDRRYRDVYCDVDYVKNEVMQLAGQIKAIEIAVPSYTAQRE